jgi:16S rRNA (guanine527-N7)-methyltransferase
MNDREDASRLLTVSRETERRLALYAALLRRWQRVLNLVAASTLDQIWMRHIADSAQLLELAPRARCWIDMGSGAGFPGLVLAICLAEQGGSNVHLIESDRRKVAFLREVARQTNVGVQIHNARIEVAMPSIVPPVDVVTARALAPLRRLVEMGKMHLDRGAIGLFPKGQDVDRELTEATKYSKYCFQLAPSRTHANGRIVRVTTPQLFGNP